LLPIFPSAQFTLNDLAPDMLKKAKEKIGKIPKINFVQGDMDNLNFGHNQLVTSNLSMQWTNDLEHSITKLNDNSDILAFSCLLDGTFKEWTKIFEGLSMPIPTYTYPCKKELERFIRSLGPKKYFFDSQEYVMEFDSPLSFLKYLKNLGAGTSCQKIPFTDLRKILKTYQQKINITYSVFFGILGPI
jgi:malonyl-CoA O-methyltransferase